MRGAWEAAGALVMCVCEWGNCWQPGVETVARGGICSRDGISDGFRHYIMSGCCIFTLNFRFSLQPIKNKYHRY